MRICRVAIPESVPGGYSWMSETDKRTCDLFMFCDHVMLVLLLLCYMKLIGGKW